MPWITFTEDHILEALSAAEIDAVRKLQLAPGQEDPVTEAIKRTCGQIHGYVSTRYPIGAAGTIPEQLLTSAISIARWRVIGRLPVKLFATENRRLEYEDAVKELESIPTGKFKLSIPEDPAEEQPGQTGGGAWGGERDF